MAIEGGRQTDLLRQMQESLLGPTEKAGSQKITRRADAETSTRR